MHNPDGYVPVGAFREDAVAGRRRRTAPTPGKGPGYQCRSSGIGKSR